MLLTYFKVEVHVGFKATNCESFPYIMHIVDELQKFPPQMLSYMVYDFHVV